MAKRGPDFEIKLIEGGEMLNDYNYIKINVSYSTPDKSGSVTYNPTGNLVKKGYAENAENYNGTNRFAKVIGHDKSPQIQVKTIDYTLSLTMTLNKQAFQRSFNLSLGKRLSEKMFLKDDFSDVKILCNGKTFP